MTELIGVPIKEYPAFMAGLSFLAALDPDDALAALRIRADVLTVKLAALKGAMEATKKAGFPRLFELEVEYEEELLAAEQKFVAGTHRGHRGRGPRRPRDVEEPSTPTGSIPEEFAITLEPPSE